MMGFYGHGWPGLIIGWVFAVVVLVGVVLLIVWALRRSGGSPPQSSSAQGPSAKEVAQMRYAKGEINREEYQQIINDLNS